MSAIIRSGIGDTNYTLGSKPRTLLRTDEATRLPRPFRIDDHDHPRSASEDTRPHTSNSYTPRPITPALESSSLEDGAFTRQSAKENDWLEKEQTTELFKRAIEDARQETCNALAAGREISDIVKPKLTIDLGHSRITRITDEVINLIKNDVERLSLSDNHISRIPPQFKNCEHLRYLNIRKNSLKEIPRGVCPLIS